MQLVAKFWFSPKNPIIKPFSLPPMIPNNIIDFCLKSIHTLIGCKLACCIYIYVLNALFCFPPLGRYLVLANMLMESEVNPFDGQEAKP